MTKERQLLPDIEPRACEVCGYLSPRPPGGNRFNRPKRGETPIVALNITVYLCRPGRGKQLATARRVRVCENCLVPILGSAAGMNGIKGRVLAQRLFESVRDRYSSMCEAKVA